MLFKDHHIEQIRSGSKTVTRREWADNYAGPNVGTVVAAKTEMLKPDDECDCFIRILDVYDEPLGEVGDEDAQKEGDYETREEFIEGYEAVYGEGTWDPEKVVDVVEFEYVGRERPEDGPEQTKLATDGGTAEDSSQRTEHCEDDTNQCPNCGGESNQTADGDNRICWECGKRWSP